MNNNGVAIERRIFGPELSKLTLFYAHGAGAGTEHEFNQYFCRRLAEMGYRVVAFNFPYMQNVYRLNKKRPPDRLPVLIEHFHLEIENEKRRNPNFEHSVLIGKSMGGRVATHLTIEHIIKEVSGIIVLGYPFMPSGKVDKFDPRTEHFQLISKPTLILQGERDVFGNKEFFEANKDKAQLVNKYASLFWINDGDHSFKPRKRASTNELENFESALFHIKQFIQDKI